MLVQKFTKKLLTKRIYENENYNFIYFYALPDTIRSGIPCPIKHLCTILSYKVTNNDNKIT